MIRDSEQWEGQVVKGKFQLGRVLGGSEGSSVFLVDGSTGVPEKAVIRLAAATSAEGRDPLQRWEEAAKLSHPNLMRIFETGRCQLAGKDLFYAVSEYGEENLAQIIPERALTVDEARQLLRDLLAALVFIHGKGLVHGSLKPSNIFAIGDSIKASSDTLRPAGRPLEIRPALSAYAAPELTEGILLPTADIWSLGVTLTEALTQRLPLINSHRKQAMLPQGISQPFQEIVENCLQVNPAGRWTLAQIAGRLEGGKPQRPVAPPAPQAAARIATPPTPEPQQSLKWPYVVVLAVATILGVVLISRPKAPVSEHVQPAASESKPAIGQPAPATSPSSLPANRDGQVAERVMPALSTSAVRTIQGRIRIQLELSVDKNGVVTDARFKTRGPSRYFAEKSLDAAQKWKFDPPVKKGQAVASEWRVRFLLSRRAIDASAEQIKP